MVKVIRTIKKTDNIIKIEQALGIKQGKPMQVRASKIPVCNINFEVNKTYKRNCASCVVASELRRRGFKVTARPIIPGKTTEKVGMDTTLPWIDPNTGKKPVLKNCGGSLKREEETGRRTRGSIKAVTTALSENTQEAGRYNISFTWKNKHLGHIINLERFDDGRVKIFDPQSGKPIIYDELVPKISLRRGFDLLRVDNLELNTDIINEIVMTN